VPARRPALLIADEGTLAYNPLLLARLREEFDVDVLEHTATRFAGRRELMTREFALLGRLLTSRATYRRAIFLCGSGHWAALAVARLIPRPVVLFNFYLHELGRNAAVRRLLASLLTDHVAVLAQSPADRDYFRGLSSRAAVILVPYGQDPVEGVAEEEATLGDYVFAGGHTNRDYGALLRCAARRPRIPFVVVASRATDLAEPVPGNVTVHRDLPMKDFHHLLAGARLVAVPLAEDVGSSGQMVTLAAMQLGKAVVAADTPAVAQYLDDETGVSYELGSDDALCAAIAALYDDRERLERLGGAARARYYERFTRSAFVEEFLAAVTERTRPPATSP
jgi:glycosyltransferase involved in cell wall biosynthesis